MDYNKDLKLKFMRGLICPIYGHKYVSILDDVYYGVKKLNESNDDIKSLFKITECIENCEFDLSVSNILKIYLMLIPSIEKNQIDGDEAGDLYDYMKCANGYRDLVLYFSKNNIFGCLNYQICSIIICKLNYLKTREYYIFFPEMGKDFKNAYIENDYQKFNSLFRYIERKNTLYNVRKKQYDINVIKHAITNCYNEFSTFSIEAIYLFGSYAKKRNNEYSDIDLHIITEIDYCIKEQENILNDYFSNILKTPVDVKVSFTSENITENKRYLFVGEILLWERK